MSEASALFARARGQRLSILSSPLAHVRACRVAAYTLAISSGVGKCKTHPVLAHRCFDAAVAQNRFADEEHNSLSSPSAAR